MEVFRHCHELTFILFHRVDQMHVFCQVKIEHYLLLQIKRAKGKAKVSVVKNQIILCPTENTLPNIKSKYL